MIPLDSDNIDQILEEFSSDELVNLSDDLLNVAIELTFQDDLDLPLGDSISRGNDLLVIIPKVIASRLNKAAIYSQKFAALTHEDLVFVGYPLHELRNIRKLLEDVITLIERRSNDDLHIIYREIFEELKDNLELDVELYRNALQHVNEAYKIQSRHVMTRAIDIYKHITTYSFEHFLRERFEVLETYQKHLNDAVDLLESSEVQDKYAPQLSGLRKTLILVLEALNTNTIGTGFSGKKVSYIHNILYHIRANPLDYIFDVIRRFATLYPDKTLIQYMSPEEIAVRYKTRYIKHNRVLLSFISNPIDVKNDVILEASNNILKNLSIGLNVKLQFVRIHDLCERILLDASSYPTLPYPPKAGQEYLQQLENALTILEKHPSSSEYLEALQEKLYQAAIVLIEWSQTPPAPKLLPLLTSYQLYAARRLFALRILTLCVFLTLHSEQQLALLTSEKILTVARELIEYKYGAIKPASLQFEAMFELERYRMPILTKIDTVLPLLRANLAAKAGGGARVSAASESAETALSAEEQSLRKTFLSQLVIDCLALKVQELDESPQFHVDPENSAADLDTQIASARERISYFLKSHQEESQQFIEIYQHGLDLFADLSMKII